MRTTKNGRLVFTYRAKFRARDTFDRPIEKTARIEAVNDFQAEKKALGIAKKNGWGFVSVGRI